MQRHRYALIEESPPSTFWVTVGTFRSLVLHADIQKETATESHCRPGHRGHGLLSDSTNKYPQPRIPLCQGRGVLRLIVCNTKILLSFVFLCFLSDDLGCFLLFFLKCFFNSKTLLNIFTL